MVRTGPTLDDVLQALAHPTRRQAVEQLGRGSRSVKELAAPFDLALPTFLAHLRVLEASGLVRTHKVGRVRHVELVPRQLASVGRWLDAQRALWQRRLDQLDAFLTETHRDDAP